VGRVVAATVFVNRLGLFIHDAGLLPRSDCRDGRFTWNTAAMANARKLAGGGF
jgi:hypothetical protein